MQDKSKAILTLRGLEIIGISGKSFKLEEIVIDGQSDLSLEPGELENTNKAAVAIIEKVCDTTMNVMNMMDQMDQRKSEHSDERQQKREEVTQRHNLELQNLRHEHNVAMEKLRHELTNANTKARATHP